MKNKKIDMQNLSRKWPSAYVARTQVEKFSGGLIAPATLANYDCRGEGSKGMVRFGRKVAYPVESLVEWLEERVTEG